MKKNITENENILINELLVRRLKHWYNTDRSKFDQLHDLLDLPLYINNRSDLNYDYFNEAALLLGAEVKHLNRTQKHSDLEIWSNPILFKNTKQIAKRFNELNDLDAVCKLPQEVALSGNKRFFFSDKVLLDNKSSLNLVSFPDNYGSLGVLVEEIIPRYAKDIVTWQRFKSLTRREKAILKLVVKGYNFKEISDQMFISYHTVATHKKNIHQKLQVKNLNELLLVSIALDFFNYNFY